MDWTIWSECVEHEGKGDVVGDVDKLISLSLLYDDVADVTARGDRCLIERRCLSGLPLEEEIGALDGASAPNRASAHASWRPGTISTATTRSIGSMPAGSDPS